VFVVYIRKNKKKQAPTYLLKRQQNQFLPFFGILDLG